MTEYDFSGYATRNDLKCADGRIIRHGAFKECDGLVVPLVWQHRHDTVDNVLGHALLENRDDGVYAYCTFNDTEAGETGKKLVKHGDVRSLSIYANKLVQKGADVIHGAIREVSLVLAGANPGAFIENVSLVHSDGSYDFLDDEVVMGFDSAIEHADDAPEEPEKASTGSEEEDEDSGRTIAEIFDTLNEEQEEAVYAVIGSLIADEEGEEALAQSATELDDDATIGDILKTLTPQQEMAVAAVIGSLVEDEVQEGTDMKHNVFDAETDTNVLTHSDMATIIGDAKRNGSLKEATLDYLNHDEEALEHGITDIELLFPEAQMVGGNQPGFVQRRMEWVGQVMGAVHKSPFSRVKSNAANITMEEARARGYIKGNQKQEEQFTLLKRTTSPQTIYKLQKLDRDDIVDITDFDVVAWMKGEMRMMLDEELARAILVGDGRSAASDDKISEDHIRPIWTDDEVYAEHTVLASSTSTTDIIDAIIRAKKGYKGSGQPVLYIGTDLLTDMRLLKDGDGYRRYKSDQELANDLRVSKIVEIEMFDGLTREVNGVTRTLGCIIVNLADYNVGANKGGQVTLFDDFDLNFNKYEYLIETRCSGALFQPKSALVIEFATTGLSSIYVAVAEPSGNPKTNGYFEKEGILYVPTKDTTVTSGKTYYELA